MSKENQKTKEAEQCLASDYSDLLAAKKELAQIKADTFTIKQSWLYCKCCGHKYDEIKQKDIIKRRKKEFETIKAANIKWLEVKIKELTQKCG